MAKPELSKDHNVFTQLGLAVGVLEQKSDETRATINFGWLGAPFDTTLALNGRRAHLFNALLPLVGDEDERRLFADQFGERWFHLHNSLPALSLVLVEKSTMNPLIGLGTRWQRNVPPGGDKIRARLELRGWALGLRNLDDSKNPFVLPTQLPELVRGQFLLELPDSALRTLEASVGLAARDEFSTTVGLRLADFRAASAPLAVAWTFGKDASSATDAALAGVKLALFLARSYIWWKASKGSPLAQRLAKHLFPLFGDGDKIPAFPLDEMFKDTSELAGWLRKFAPTDISPTINADTAFAAVYHLYALFMGDKDGDEQQLQKASAIAWFSADSPRLGVFLHKNNDGLLRLGVVAESASPAARVWADVLQIPKDGSVQVAAAVSVDPPAGNLTFSFDHDTIHVKVTVGPAPAIEVTVAGNPTPVLNARKDALTLRLPLSDELARRLVLEVSTGSGALVLTEDVSKTVLLSLASGGTVTLPTLDVVKLAAVPLLHAVLTGPLLDAKLAAGVTLADLLKGAGVLRNGVLADVSALKLRNALHGVATELFGKLEPGFDVGPLQVKPRTNNGVLGLELTPTKESEGVLFQEGPLKVRWNRLAFDLVKSAVDGSFPVAPTIFIDGLGFDLGGDRPIFADGNFALNGVGVTVSARAGLGAGDGFALDKVAIRLDQLRLPFGGGAGLAGKLLPSDGAEGPGLSFTLTYEKGALTLDQFKQRLVIDRQIGPLDVTAVRLEKTSGTGDDRTAKIGVRFEASFKLGPITIVPDGLGVDIPVRSLFNPAIREPEADRWTFHLDGLGLAFEQGGVAIAGMFRKREDTYEGLALIKAFGFQVGAVGAYGTVAGQATLYLFGALNAPLGGPPFFFVTGVAAGFGYNYDLRIPEYEKIPDHPFFMLMRGSAKIESLDTSAYLDPAPGNVWFAGGVTFTSFALIQGHALLYVVVGRYFKIGLAALASFGIANIVNVELALKGEFSTANGDPTLLVLGGLTRNSWLFSENACKLTGGFAFQVWFARGQCVLTVGGYHPRYRPPAHFPRVPRLGFRGNFGGAIVVKGEVYFAVVPRAAMGGASLEVAGRWGPLGAGFSASFDALIGWDPFFFMLRIAVCVWIELGFRAELGVELSLHGPPVGGTAHISLLFFSFDIPFGRDDPPPTSALSVRAFVERMLKIPVSAGDDRQLVQLRGRSIAAETGARTTDGQGLFQLEVVRGLLPRADRSERAMDGARDNRFLVNPEPVFHLRARVPITTATYVEGPAIPTPENLPLLGFFPCFRNELASVLKLSSDGSGPKPRCTPVCGPVPRALFATSTVPPDDAGGLEQALASDGEETMLAWIGLTIDATATPHPADAEVRSTAPEYCVGRYTTPTPPPGWELEEFPLPLKVADLILPPVPAVIADTRVAWARDAAPALTARLAWLRNSVPRARTLGPRLIAAPLVEHPGRVHVATSVAAPIRFTSADTPLGQVVPLAADFPAYHAAARIDVLAELPLRPRVRGTTTKERRFDPVATHPVPRERVRRVELGNIELHRITGARDVIRGGRVGRVRAQRLAFTQYALHHPQGHVLAPGQTLVLLDLSPGLGLALHGGQAARVLTFDQFGKPLAAVTMMPTESQTSLRFPPRTDRVVCVGVGQDPGACTRPGLDANTALVQAAPSTWAAPGAALSVRRGPRPAASAATATAGELLRGAEELALWLLPDDVLTADGELRPEPPQDKRLLLVWSLPAPDARVAESIRWTLDCAHTNVEWFVGVHELLAVVTLRCSGVRLHAMLTNGARLRAATLVPQDAALAAAWIAGAAWRLDDARVEAGPTSQVRLDTYSDPVAAFRAPGGEEDHG